MKFVYYLAAFGPPHLNKKIEVLSSNLLYLNRNLKHSFDLIINCYDTNPITSIQLKKIINNFKFINNFDLYVKKGVLSELFLTNPYNKKIKNYDYILFTLDDIKILKIDINQMINTKKKYNISFLSPKVRHSSFRYMYKYHYNIVTINNFLEIFMLLLSSRDFFRFINLHTYDNKWMWGVDHLFGYFKIRAGITNRNIVDHLFTGSSDKNFAYSLAKEYFALKTCFKNLKEIRKKYSPVARFIHEKKK